MSKIVRVNKPIVLKFENRKINLPKELEEKIEKFWKEAVEENSNLYNGEDYAVETELENEEKIEMTVVKSSYAHYLYNERIGIKEEKYRCSAPWGGILLITKEGYLVIGEMEKTTSIPYCLQTSGGGIEQTDIINGEINISLCIKRELKEELNLELDDIDYSLEYIEYPDEKRNAYGFIAVGKINKTKKELTKHFEKYKKYLEENELELEFRKLIFLEKEEALKELDSLPNYKRPYLRNLIEEVVKKKKDKEEK